MTTHILHSVTCNDGATGRTLAPPTWDSMSYTWEPVPIRSLFEAYDGSATLQVNSGATQKRRIRLDVTGKCAPKFDGMNYATTWTLTLVRFDSISAATGYTVWPLGPPTQTIDANGGERAWTMEFRQA